jgi:hypothetical protein
MQQQGHRGVLFRNEKKEREGQPDYKGNATVDGKEHWLSAWINTSQKDGSKYMSVSFQPKEELVQDNSPHQVYKQAPGEVAFDDLEDDLEKPF